MKNVKCKKLIIDRSKAPQKLGTLKDISLFGSFQFPSTGGLVARSLAGIGKELKKTQEQLKSLANRTHPLAGSTGAVTTDEIPFSTSSIANQNHTQSHYSVNFVQHATHQQLSTDAFRPMDAAIKQSLPKSSFALKSGGGKRTVFTLEQKEVMMEFYNRQANYGIRADPIECLSAMRARGLEVLKESQIKSWWSSYHQKRKREMERMATEIQNAHVEIASAPVVSSAASSQRTSSVPVVSSTISSQATVSATVVSSAASSQRTSSVPVVSSTISIHATVSATVVSSAASNQRTSSVPVVSSTIGRQAATCTSAPVVSSVASSQRNPAVPVVTSTIGRQATISAPVVSSAASSQRSPSGPVVSSTIGREATVSAPIVCSAASSQRTPAAPVVSSTIASQAIVSPPVVSSAMNSQPPTSLTNALSSTVATSHMCNLSSPGNFVGNDVGYGVTEWLFPWNVSQSTLDGRNGSNACVFIALCFGRIHQTANPANLQGHQLSSEWQEALKEAIRMGNSMHDELYDRQGVNVTLEDAMDAIGTICQIGGVQQEFNVFGSSPLDQLEDVVHSICQQSTPSFHVLMVNDMAMLLIVDSDGNLILVDSHMHGSMGALIARSVPDQGNQAQWFSHYFNRMLTQTWGVGLCMCSLSTIRYL